MRTSPLLFVRLGWAVWYDDREQDDEPRRGGSFRGLKSEANNHRPIRGWCYGYVHVAGAERFGINLARLGAASGALQLDGVTVIEVATQPGGGQRVVGLYRNATCLAEGPPRPNKIYGYYNFMAREKDCTLLPLEQRTINVPKAPGAFGNSNVCYPDPRAKWVKQVMRELAALPESHAAAHPRTRAPRARGQGRMMDAAKRAAIEQHAMEVAMRYFERRWSEVSNVSSTESIDLRCRRGRETLLVEVKGTTADTHDVELIFTRNEIDLAHDPTTPTALFIVRGIEVNRQRGDWKATGGTSLCVRDWHPATARLQATAYRYRFDVLARR